MHWHVLQFAPQDEWNNSLPYLVFLFLQLNKRFILSFLHAHGKLFTKVGWVMSGVFELLQYWIEWKHLNRCVLCLNYTAWSPSLEWPAVSCRSSGRCCSMARLCWAAHTCCRSSPSTCSPFTTTTAGVRPFWSFNCRFYQHWWTNLFCKMVIVLLFFSLFLRRRRRSAICSTWTKHRLGSGHVCIAGAALHRAAKRYSSR